MTQYRSFAQRENGGKEAAVAAQARVPYRVHAALDAMEPTCPNSLVHRLPAEAEVNQLAARDQPVLVRGKRGDSLIDGALGEFAYHW